MNAVMPATAGSPNSAVAVYPQASYPLTVDASAPLPLVRWMFYLFMFSVPLLHTIDVGEDTRLPKLIGLGESTTVDGAEKLQPGKSYSFHCSLHPGMHGTLVVQ